MRTSCPSLCNAIERADTASANPPVLAKGAASAEIIKIRIVTSAFSDYHVLAAALKASALFAIVFSETQ